MTSGATASKEHLLVVPPEGVPLTFEIATAGDRAAAFLVDVLIMVGAGAVGLLLQLAVLDSAAATAVMQIVFFILFAFYFTIFEIRWQGRTPGKRLLGLQVIDARGHPLMSRALFARNLTRKVEFVLPLLILSDPELLWPGTPGWARLASIGWLLVLLVLPLLNRRRQRVGDFIAHTVVVQIPRRDLLPDLTESGGAEVSTYEYAFRPRELDLYGIYELQTLEKVLRDPRTPVETLRAISNKICKKIGWTDPRVRPRPFLRDFYAQLRAHLEQKLLFGQRQERKKAGTIHDAAGTGERGDPAAEAPLRPRRPR